VAWAMNYPRKSLILVRLAGIELASESRKITAYQLQFFHFNSLKST
jgi:hypothetical protein